MLLAMDVGNTNTVLGLYRLASDATTPASRTGVGSELANHHAIVQADQR